MAVESSILNTIKKMLGLSPNDIAFDVDITVHINSVFMILNQLGIGGPIAFMITGPEDIWDQVEVMPSSVEALKTFMYLRVRLLFDPPASGSVLSAMKEQAEEFGWRLKTQVESEQV